MTWQEQAQEKILCAAPIMIADETQFNLTTVFINLIDPVNPLKSETHFVPYSPFMCYPAFSC